MTRRQARGDDDAAERRLFESRVGNMALDQASESVRVHEPGAALVNFRFIANTVWTTKEAVKAMQAH